MVLSIILWGLAAVLLLVLAVLAFPLRVEMRASAGDALRYSLALRPFGRFGPRLTVADSEKPSKRKMREAKNENTRTGKSTVRDPRRMFRAGVMLGADIVTRLRIENTALDLRFGADDPAETGQIYGALTPFIYGTRGSERMSLNIEPVFDGAVFDGSAALDISLTPARLILPFVRFGWAAFGPAR